jgi:PIN domain nuclease of toxin-antitoxin system
VTLLLDTHSLLWWLENSAKMTRAASAAIRDSDVYVSVASAWEIAIKSNAKKLDHGDVVIAELEVRLREQGFAVLSITLDHAIRAGLLPLHHRDPFDRMLAAQAQAESLPIVSNDRIFDQYGIRRIW